MENETLNAVLVSIPFIILFSFTMALWETHQEQAKRQKIYALMSQGKCYESAVIEVYGLYYFIEQQKRHQKDLEKQWTAHKKHS